MQVYHLPSSAPINPLVVDQYEPSTTPIVIDNGATSLRYGFATAPAPRSANNIMSRFKDRKSNATLLLFGDAVELEAATKSQARTPWEGDILLNFDALECALDYVFITLGIDTHTIEHPILMSERLCTPLHSRALTSELLFELYSAPAVTYCVDSLMSFYQNSPTHPDAHGLVVSFNSNSTSILPVLHGKGILSHAKRLPYGAAQASDYLLKLLQLKYPNFPTRILPSHSSWMLQNFCEFSTDYPARLKLLRDPLNMRESERIIQFPYVINMEVEKTEEELARQAEKRKETGKRLQEQLAKRRVEALMKKENDLQELVTFRDSRAEHNGDWTNLLRAEGFENEQELEDTIKKLDAQVKKARRKEMGEEELPQPQEEPTFPLLDIPDAQLDEEGLKEKKKQRLLKAGFDARMRARREKEKEKEAKEMEERREIEEREQDPEGWSERMRKEHEAMVAKFKERKRRKAALSDRKSAVAQARMKNIASLANDLPPAKKRRKGNHEDTFGANDEDWAIYRKIQTAGGQSSDEEDDLVQLLALEEKLLAHDPSFTQSDTYASRSAQRSALISAFRPIYEDGDSEGQNRIHLNVERWRVCEAWFSPMMAGVDCAGLGELMGSIVNRFDDPDKARLAQNVFVTGSPSVLPNLLTRLHSTLRPILPPEMNLNVVQAQDPRLDAWRGMAKFAQTNDFPATGTTRAEYDEHGAERVKRWWGGNWPNDS